MYAKGSLMDHKWVTSVSRMSYNKSTFSQYFFGTWASESPDCLSLICLVFKTVCWLSRVFIEEYRKSFYWSRKLSTWSFILFWLTVHISSLIFRQSVYLTSVLICVFRLFVVWADFYPAVCVSTDGDISIAFRKRKSFGSPKRCSSIASFR